MLEESDYDKILDKYYDDFLYKYPPRTDFSGWEYSPLGLDDIPLPSPPCRGELKRYYADSGSRLSEFKYRIARFLAEMGCKSINVRNFMLLPSTTTAITIMLSFLKEKGVTRMAVEAPAYYAVLVSAKRLGLQCDLLEPLEVEEGIFSTDVEACEKFLSEDGTCLWLHQPRYSIGQDMDSSSLLAFAAPLVGIRFIIVDEANDDSLPNRINVLDGLPNIFRLRNLSKPFGMNGIRLALVIHPEPHKERLSEIMWSVGGALDWYSLAFGELLASKPGVYSGLLKQTRDQLDGQRRILAAALSGSHAYVLPSTTGFLACIRLQWAHVAGTEGEKRRKLIDHFSENHVPAMLGSHIYIPKRIGFEHVRVNLFNTPEALQKGAEVICSFS
jgi:histidinol-phosphate/aromatic aminotransferase/cobyric acid decarboxylase-like protein